MSDIVIQAEGLSKKYRIGAHEVRHDTLVESVAAAASAPFRRMVRLLRYQSFGAADTDDTIWALKDISFEVRRGEVVGIIGYNGAGKTTLLRIFSRITTPTEGYARIWGRVGSLLEVGTGFHAELTGRENIYLNGAVLGMKKKDIDRKFDDIVDFSGVEKFIDTPLKRYSSGMQVRLAFAVAAHLEPEILLVDEVLAVGDYKFQEKCLGKMKDITGQGRTVLFVSHNMRAISQICTRLILLTDGRIESDGDTETVLRQYTGAERPDTAEVTWSPENAPGNQSVRLLGVHVRGKDGKVRSEFNYTEPISLCVTFLVLDDKVDLYLRMYLKNEDDVLVLATTAMSNPRFNKGIHEAKYTIAPHFLNEGRYRVWQVLFKEGIVTSIEDVARVDYPVSFKISYSGQFTGGLMRKQPGIVRPDWDWEISEIK